MESCSDIRFEEAGIWKERCFEILNGFKIPNSLNIDKLSKIYKYGLSSEVFYIKKE